MLYDRKVRYLDYLEAGVRLSGGGFVRTEVRNRVFCMELAVRGIPHFNGDFPVCILSDDGELAVGTISISHGNGSFRYEAELKEEAGRTEAESFTAGWERTRRERPEGDRSPLAISYGNLTGIRIPLEGEREVSCRWMSASAAAHKSEKIAGPSVNAETADELRAGTKPKMPVKPEVMVKSEMPVKPEAMVKSETPVKPEAATRSEVLAKFGMPAMSDAIGQLNNMGTGKKEVEAAELSGGIAEITKDTNAGAALVTRLKDDKWSQLCSIYPEIRPFKDERTYLSLGPADFVILPEADYRAANNSFLLHGYYNYRHLILTQTEKKGQIIYYLGVPGNYFEKEKQVAVMFGFESFECAREPAEYGDFGYYMMRVHL